MTTVEIPDNSLFGTNNLPYGIFSTSDQGRRVGTRLGDSVVDLAQILGEEVFRRSTMNAFMRQGHRYWTEVRERIGEHIRSGIPDRAVYPVHDVRLHMPFEIGDYVDFYASEHHASNLGRLFRPESEPLMPNWKHLPVGYHGRAGTVVVSGTDVVRPSGQRKAAEEAAPTFGPSHRLDIEAELGFVVGSGSALGTTVPCDNFAEHVFGVVLVNDWSARDIQAWESAPLGPFLGKSFATSVSPWVIPTAALEAARVPVPEQDPRPMPYLRENEDWGLDIQLSVEWNGVEVSRPPYREMYWSPAQMLAHLTANGARLRTGDLFASGTVSGPSREQCGAFIELTWGGWDPVRVHGRERTFVEDGDEIAISATAPGPDGRLLGLGEVRSRVLPAG